MRLTPRTMTAAVLGAVASLAVSAPIATAQLEPEPAPPSRPVVTAVPEGPTEGNTPFANNPEIVDAHPQSVQAWSPLPDGNVIQIRFTTGTPECYGVAAEVQETADIVAVKLTSGTLPAIGERACIAIGVVGSLDVPLQSPIGNRAVVSIT